MNTKKFCLAENQMPTQWYNIVADMPTKPLPPLDPATKRPVTKEQMSAIFAEELIDQEMSTQRFIDIPEEVQEIYKIWRPTPLVRATGLEKALDTPAKIYFKNESVSPAGSHKPNTAVPQAYYNYKQGIKHLTTETGAGQWGASIAFASKHFGIDLRVFMVRVSYDPATQDTLEQADGQPWIEWEDAGPVACEAGWDHYRHDSGVSRTWEMCDPPKSNVTSSTLARLLGPLSDCDRKRVTVVFHVLPPDKTAFMAEQNRQRAANQVSQEKRASISAMSQINKANRQAIETNRGAAIVFFGMLVTATVRAGDDERMRLEQATHAVEGAAGSAKIDLRPCYGAQDTAFAASLPLGLNLRNYTPPSAFAALS